MKLMFGFGIYAAFRGIREHQYLSPSHVKLCSFPLNHPLPDLAGTEYIAVTCLPDEKTNKLSVNNSYVRDTSDLLKIPVDHNDPKNFGACVIRFLGKLAPGQVRMYCKVADAAHRAKLAAQGFPNAQFCANQHLGEKSIRQLFKEGAKMLGLSSQFRPHSLRGACITKLVNDPGVSLAETMSHARHSSASASRNYQRVDSVSEAGRFRALGLMPSSGNLTMQKSMSHDSGTSPKLDGAMAGIGGGRLKEEYRGDVTSDVAGVSDGKKGVYAGCDMSGSMTGGWNEDVLRLQRQVSHLQGALGERVASTSVSNVKQYRNDMKVEVAAGTLKSSQGTSSSSSSSSVSDDEDNNLLLVDVTSSQRKKIRLLNKLIGEKEKKIVELEKQNKELFRLFGGKYGVVFNTPGKVEKKKRKKKVKKGKY